MKKFKSIKREGFTVSQANLDGWIAVIQRNLVEARLLTEKAEEYLGAVREFVLENFHPGWKEKVEGKK